MSYTSRTGACMCTWNRRCRRPGTRRVRCRSSGARAPTGPGTRSTNTFQRGGGACDRAGWSDQENLQTTVTKLADIRHVEREMMRRCFGVKPSRASGSSNTDDDDAAYVAAFFEDRIGRTSSNFAANARTASARRTSPWFITNGRRCSCAPTWSSGSGAVANSSSNCV